MGYVLSVVVSLAVCAAISLAGCSLNTRGNLLRFSASSSGSEVASGSDTADSSGAASSRDGSEATGMAASSTNDNLGEDEDVLLAKIPPPVVKSPRPGATLLIGRNNRIEIKPYASTGVDRIKCSLWRDRRQLASTETDIGQTDACELSSLHIDMLGEAELVIRGRVYDTTSGAETWGPPARQKVTLAAATPKPGPTPDWDGLYKMEPSGGYFHTDDVTVRNGTLTATLKVKDNSVADPSKSIFTLTPFQLKVDSDGTIVPQQVTLNVTQRPANVSVWTNQYLASVKTIWVYGEAKMRLKNAHAVELTFQGPTVKVDNEGTVQDVTWSDLQMYYRDDVVWAPATSSGGGSRGGGRSREGGRGNSDACEKACFHTEATCHGKRGDCMKARQACVKSCR